VVASCVGVAGSANGDVSVMRVVGVGTGSVPIVAPNVGFGVNFLMVDTWLLRVRKDEKNGAMMLFVPSENDSQPCDADTVVIVAELTRMTDTINMQTRTR
jgi:hypothetical protein